MIPVGEWLPDLPAMSNPGALQAKNVIPDATSYRPLPAMVAFSNALSVRAQGAFACRSFGSTPDNVCGTATKLYRLSSATWSDISGAATFNCGAEGNWRFTQFGNLIVAVNGTDNPQKITIGSGNAADLGGTPPVAKYTATVKDFVWLGNISSQSHRVQWSGLDNAETWGSAPTTTEADYQDLADGGAVTGLIGGEIATVLQERAVRVFQYEGQPLIFRRYDISNGVGCNFPNSVAQHQGVVFFAGYEGFHAISGGQMQDIGNRKVNRYFLNDLDETYSYRITATCDPVNGLYMIAYPGAGHVGGVPNKALIFNVREAKWSNAEFDCELLYSAFTSAGYTLDTLDSIFPSGIDASPFNIDSSLYAGTGRLGVAAFDTSHRMAFFTGSPMAACVDTTEAQLQQGHRAMVTAISPLVDGGNPTTQVGSRNRQVDPVTWSAASSLVTRSGAPYCAHRVEARYHRARIATVAGDNWTHIQGVDFEAVPVGRL